MLIVEQKAHDIDIASGRAVFNWPAHDGRPSMLRNATDEIMRQMTLAFIAGYRAANPGASDAEVHHAVM